MNTERRILNIAEGIMDLSYSRELRAIALEVRKREDRIKRLEEAGDMMERYCDAISADNWRKAKEAKP